MHWPTGVLYGLPSKNSISTTNNPLKNDRVCGPEAQRPNPAYVFVIGGKQQCLSFVWLKSLSINCKHSCCVRVYYLVLKHTSRNLFPFESLSIKRMHKQLYKTRQAFVWNTSMNIKKTAQTSPVKYSTLHLIKLQWKHVVLVVWVNII